MDEIGSSPSGACAKVLAMTTGNGIAATRDRSAKHARTQDSPSSSSPTSRAAPLTTCGCSSAATPPGTPMCGRGSSRCSEASSHTSLRAARQWACLAARWQSTGSSTSNLSPRRRRRRGARAGGCREACVDAADLAAGLQRITLHECRHTFASLMIAAGVNAKALSTYMGHANISITLDRYGTSCPATRMRLPACSTPTWRAPPPPLLAPVSRQSRPDWTGLHRTRSDSIPRSHWDRLWLLGLWAMYHI